MKVTLTFILLSSMATLLWFCKPTTYTADNLPKKTIKWGSGGGVVGKETSFLLLDNGQVFKAEGAAAPMVSLKKIKSKTAVALFDAASTLELEAVALNNPGNTYKFIEIGKEDGTSARLTWGGKDEIVPQKVSDLLVVLGQLLKD